MNNPTMLAEPVQTEEGELHALYERMMDGWNRGSGVAFAAGWADEGQLIGFDGTHLRGREAIERFHETLFRTHLKGTRLVGQVTQIEFPAPDVAVMHARGGTIMRGGAGPTPERDSLQTLVAVRRSEWQLVALQNTRLRPIARNPASTLLWLVSDWLWKLLRSGKQEA
jgi:uncharacterized protein (TIGR02246 family)